MSLTIRTLTNYPYTPLKITIPDVPDGPRGKNGIVIQIVCILKCPHSTPNQSNFMYFSGEVNQLQSV